MATIVSRARLAELRGVSKAAVTKALRGPLKAACVDDRVDLDHPDVQAWLGSGKPPKGKADGAPTAAAKKLSSAPPAPTKGRPAPSKPPPATLPLRPPKLDPRGFASELAPFTLSDIVERFGSVRSYLDLTDANGKRERAYALRLKNDAAEGKIISRELVRTHIFGALDGAFRRLLGDSAKTIARRVYALAKGGTPIEEAERVVVEIISSQLKRSKETAVRVLRTGT